MRYWLFKVKVSGESMWPALVPGSTYWASNLLTPQVGRIAVFRQPNNKNEFAVKKIIEIKKHRLKLDGTVSWSTAYEIDAAEVVGVLLGNFTKARD